MKKRSSILLLSIIAASFCSFNTFASDTASSTFSIDVSNAALQVTAPATASIELNPTSSSAVFGSTNITVNVATNNMTGYTITMTVPTTDLTHSTITGDNAPVIPTLQSQAPESTFPANAWGYKVTGDNFNPVQLTNTNPSWVTENPTNGTDHIISLAAKVDGTKHSGTYTNTLTFNVVANPNAARDTIVFDKNNEDATGTMENQTAYQGIATKLNKNNFTLSGMRFAGWSTTASGTGEGVRYYGDESTITTDLGDSSKTITLYAQWAPSGTPTPTNPAGVSGTTIQRAYEIAYTAMHKGMYEEQHEGQGDYALVNSWPPDNEPYKNYDVRFAMQDMTPEICASVTVMHDDYQALDIRDNKLYTIIKTKDGRCWMAENLAIDPKDPGTTMSSSDTNASSGVVTGFLANVNKVSTFSSSYTPQYNTTYVNNTSSNQDDINNNLKIGGLYNFSAAAMGQGHTNVSDTALDVTEDICPKGWRLPTGKAIGYENNGGEFLFLASKYDGTDEEKRQNRILLGLPLSGAMSESASSWNDSGIGYFWTATHDSSKLMNAGTVRSNGFGQSNYRHTIGLSVRCIAK